MNFKSYLSAVALFIALCVFGGTVQAAAPSEVEQIREFIANIGKPKPAPPPTVPETAKPVPPTVSVPEVAKPTPPSAEKTADDAAKPAPPATDAPPPDAAKPNPQPTEKPLPPAAETWNCPCGKINQSNFCPDCGTARPKEPPVYRCSCGWEATLPQPPNFCPDCGKAIGRS